jgi:hypothetical protein
MITEIPPTVITDSAIRSIAFTPALDVRRATRRTAAGVSLGLGVSFLNKAGRSR